jgi:L-rhamnose mutarotase
MARHAWIAELNPGCEEEYEKAHDEIWPEMLEALRAAGFREYWIFRHGLQLILTFECDDVETLMRTIQGNPVDARWSEAMAPLMKIDRNPRTGFPFFLPVMFHMA